MHVHMNHAATSATKPREVIDALTAFLSGNDHQSVGRGGYELAMMQTALDARIALAGLFGADHPTNVVFTSGATESLNMAIYGLAGQGGHVLATCFEHNAVARPLYMLQQMKRIEVTWLNGGPDGSFDSQSIRSALRPDTRLLVMTHASNVLGRVLPVTESFKIAKQYGLFTVLDAAQTAGHMEVALDGNTDIIAFAGHKGLRGVAGIGGLIFNKKIADQMAVWKAGGTGSHSQSLEMPDFMPDKLEAGTRNMLGMISLKAAVEAIRAVGMDMICSHERSVTTRFVDGLKQLPVTVYGDYCESNWMPVISLNIPGMDAGQLAHRLSVEFGIETRSGLHCSPLAHKAIGTFPRGTLRFSFGVDTTMDEIDYALGAISKIACEK